MNDSLINYLFMNGERVQMTSRRRGHLIRLTPFSLTIMNSTLIQEKRTPPAKKKKKRQQKNT